MSETVDSPPQGGRVRLVVSVVVVSATLYWLFSRVRFLNASLLIFVDTLAYAWRWAGVSNPATAWALLGTVAGACVGAVIGARRSGRLMTKRPLIGFAVALVLVLLVAGPVQSLYEQHLTEDAALTSHDIQPFAMRVAADRAELHLFPAPGGSSLGTLTRGTELKVVRLTNNGEWAYVEVRGRETRWMDGWVLHSQLSSLSQDRPSKKRSALAAKPRPSRADTNRADTNRTETLPSAVAPAPDSVADRAAKLTGLVSTAERDWTSAAAIVDSGSADGYVRAAKIFQRVIADVGSFEKTLGKDAATSRVDSETRRRLATVAEACNAENKANRLRGKAEVPCPQPPDEH